jgi:hypothetical protein
MTRLGLFSSVIALAAVACAAVDQPEQRSAERPSVSQHELASLVSRAICELQEQCGASDFASVSECVAGTSTRVGDDVDAEDCQDGAWQSRIDACLVAIRAQPCPGAVDPGQLAACDEDRMCLQPEWGSPSPGDEKQEHIHGRD